MDGRSVSVRSIDADLAAIKANRSAMTAFAKQGTVTGHGVGGFDPAFVARVLDSRVEALVVAREVTQRKLVVPADLGERVSAAEDPAYARYPASYRRQVAAANENRLVLAAALSGHPLTQQAIEKAYAEHVDDVTEFCVSGLALPSKAAAERTRAALVHGAVLATVARARSIDPATRRQGGVIGCAVPDDFSVLTDEVRRLRAGQYSAPVQAGQSWYVVTVTSKRVPTLATTESVLMQDLVTSYDPFNQFLQTALGGAKVTVAKAYGRFDRSTSPPSVVAR